MVSSPMLITKPKTCGLIGRPKGLSIDVNCPRYQGYEQGGLVYFDIDGNEMVLIVRERAEFDNACEFGMSVQEYANSVVSPRAYDSAKAIEAAIEKKGRNVD